MNWYNYKLLFPLQVNGQSMLGATHQEAVRALRAVGDKLSLMVCDGFDPSLLDSSSPSHSLYSQNSRNDSISSIDREDEDSLIIRKEQEVVREQEQWEQEDLKKIVSIVFLFVCLFTFGGTLIRGALIAFLASWLSLDLGQRAWQQVIESTLAFLKIFVFAGKAQERARVTKRRNSICRR